jgi:hypothetical protein
MIVPQDKLQEAWITVRPGLTRVRERTAPRWIEEDVYAELRAGRSTLHLGYVDGVYVGFTVLTPSQTFDGMVLHIWCAHNASSYDVISLFTPELERLGRSIGARHLTFWSPRKWDRKIAPVGFKANQTEYVKELL